MTAGWRAWCLGLGMLCAVPAQAETAEDWLQRMHDASQLDYQGVFIYERNGSFSSHQLWHAATMHGERRERLLQLDGPAHEVLRVNGRTRCLSSDLQGPLAEGQVWPSRELDVGQLANWYVLRLLGSSRVAGRDAVVLGLLPRDPHRHAFELHLDRQTALPLKSVSLNEQGQMLERFQFTSLQLQTPTSTDLQPGADCRTLDTDVSALSAAQTNDWQVGWLPPGFSAQGVIRRPVPGDGVPPLQCLLFADGLARFSVFVEHLGGLSVEEAHSQLGPTVAVSRRLSVRGGEVMVTVVGEIPLGTAERIALSVREAQEQASD